jgi:16S rRNA processing protein RimM
LNDLLITVGSLVNTQGIRGEVRVISRTDFPEKRFAPGSRLLLIHKNFPAPVPLTVETVRKHKNFYLLRFKDHPTINHVEKYKGGELKVPSSELVDLPENTYYIFQLVGCEVFTEEGDKLGTLKEVLKPGANDVWVVQPTQGKEILLPAIPECILDVDTEAKKITVHVMEGLLE